nr:hypothetical protein [Tanacetum cinerariifolium]
WDSLAIDFNFTLGIVTQQTKKNSEILAITRGDHFRNKTLMKTIIKPTKEKVPTEAIDTSQSVSSGQTTDPQYTEENIQPAAKGLPSTLDEGTHSSNPLSKGKPTDAKDPWETNNPLVWDRLSLTLMKVLAKQSLYQRGPLSILKTQEETNNSLIGITLQL